MVSLPPEKMASFYLGANYDLENRQIINESVNYDSRDLTTHAICVGMTGSGKTGLCIGLLEEAALDKVPAIIIDPKGDMTNLLLQFEHLNPEDFEPWINPDDAARKGLSIQDYSKVIADTWKKGLADWGQGTERIKALKESVDYTIYTPGSDSGIPINILGSFAAPGIDFDEDAEMLRERIQGTVAALLGMIGNKEDPSRSREGILLSTLFEHHWRKQEDLDLTKIILGIQNPPIDKLGVFDIDTFFPEDDRFELAMEFNTLVASPKFSYWLQGEPLDIDKIYFTAEGKPRHSIFYIAHLSDSERMFFVTLLLNSLISWMRRQSGTSSLRSLLYFDEIFGYFPPTAQPPSKKPLLTILKQARAFGIGAVLVTQNPVDIDYKGLSNAGTWFIGKLQTERDKDRVLDGLKGALAEAGTSTKTDFSKIISALSSRVFLLHNVHDDQPQIYHTRWAMSYLRGPMTRPQVKKLMDHKPVSTHDTASNTNTVERQQPAVHSQSQLALPPSLDPDISQKFFPVWKSQAEAQSQLNAPGEDLKIIYKPFVLASGQVRFYNQKRNIDKVKPIALLCLPPDNFGRIDWEHSVSIEDWEHAITDQPDHPDTIKVAYASLPDTLNQKKDLDKVEDDFSDWIYQNQKLPIREHEKFELYQKADESDESYMNRLHQKARELRDEELDELQDKYEDKFDRINDRIRKEEHQLDQHEAELRHRKTAEIAGVAETIFSVFVKRRRRSISSISTKSRMRQRAAQRLDETKDDIEELKESYIELNEELEKEMKEINEEWEDRIQDYTVFEVSPRRSDIQIENLIICWQPFWVNASGDQVSARR